MKKNRRPSLFKHVSDIRREIWLTYAALAVTLGASVASVGGILLTLTQDAATRHWISALAHGLFLAIVSFLIYGGLVYQLSRLGYLKRMGNLRRRTDHHPANASALDQFFHGSRAPSVTILVPSYKEDPHVIRRTLLSAALQDYPSRRVVLLLDDPPSPTEVPDTRLLTAGRALPEEILECLRKPRADMHSALQGFLDRRTLGPLDLCKEVQLVAQLYQDAALWFTEQAAQYPVGDHADELFVELTFNRASREYFEESDVWAKQALEPTWPDSHHLLEAYQRLVARFEVELTSFERKRFLNLSHEPNKAMNLNSYISLMGHHWRMVGSEGALFLEPAGSIDADLSVADTDCVLMLDADSVITFDYTLRLSQWLMQPGHERMAVVQTPYSAFPKAPGILERIAGATTDIQYIIHQGFTSYGATFWVGANALVRKAALEDISEFATERGHRIRRFIQDRTVIEDTESTVDLIARGWQLHNYPERLAFSATPPDFGSLLIQRRRWANGGLLVLPKLIRYLVRHPSWTAALQEGFMRCHYLGSLAIANMGLLLILAVSLDDGLQTVWLPLTALPYYWLYARDLRRRGYPRSDLLNVYALNLLLIPVHLGGVFQSLRQAWTGRRTPFGRTPKVTGRITSPALYLIAEYVILGHWLVGAGFEFLHGRPLHGCFALANAGFLAYAIVRFIGLRESWTDLSLALGLGRRRAPAPISASTSFA
jgi:cellulose synthase/poly-beta-1,6-N-acetylglucosamine synthase-like glycosyltransferase